MALTDIEEKVERTIFEVLRLKAVEEGFTPDITNYDIDNPDDTIAAAATDAYMAALKTIQNTKGFAVDIFNYSNQQARGMKKSPRIVVQTEAFYPGEIGLDVTPQYKLNPVTGKYESLRSTTLTSNLFLNVHLVASTVKQIRALHGIMVACLPRMGYLIWYTETRLRPSHNLLVRYVSYYEADFIAEGVIEKIYRYEIPDAHEVEDIMVEMNISPIKEITVDIQTQDTEQQLNIKDD